MKLFVFINFVIGLLSLLVSMNTFMGMAISPTQIAKGLIALAIGATCVWIAKQVISESDLKTLS